MYKDAEYANSRLYETIVRLNGEPVMVGHVHGNMTCTISRDGEEEVVLLDDLDLSAPPLGYVNYRRGAVYLSRKPMRRDWRQGIRSSQLVSILDPDAGISTRMIMSCIRGGSFVPLAEALESFIERNSVALSRTVALINKGDRIAVMHRWDEVGIIEDGKIVLTANNTHLKEMMEVFND